MKKLDNLIRSIREAGAIVYVPALISCAIVVLTIRDYTRGRAFDPFDWCAAAFFAAVALLGWWLVRRHEKRWGPPA
jgi:hypothetical protein